MGIEGMLANSSQNDELQNYLNEKSYETASLGETSADELATINQHLDVVDFYRDSEVNRGLKDRTVIAQSVSDYEQVVVQEHLALDLYRSKNKTKT